MAFFSVVINGGVLSSVAIGGSISDHEPTPFDSAIMRSRFSVSVQKPVLVSHSLFVNNTHFSIVLNGEINDFDCYRRCHKPEKSL
jgi:hypothetical protein